MFDTRQIEQRIRGLRRLREALPIIAAQELRNQVIEFAASGRAPNGSAWLPLTPEYAKRKMKLVGNQKANKRLTGGLLGSVNYIGGIVKPDAAHLPQAQGLEKKRVSFEASPVTAQNIERLIARKFSAI